MTEAGQDGATSEQERWLPGDQGLEFTAADWLIDHHRADEEVRRRIVADLELRAGDRMLDVGCGPGLWLPLLAERVAPGGRVEGIDASAELTRSATRTVRGAPGGVAVGVARADFTALPYADDTFDLSFSANCLAYTPNRLDLLADQRRVTRPGGRVVAKDYDGGVLVVHPLDPALTASVVTAAAGVLAAQEADDEDGEVGFDNSVGRRLPALLRAAGLIDVTTRSYAVQTCAPLSREERRTIAVNARWYGETAAPRLTPEDLDRWRAAFDPEDPGCILDHPDFYFCMLDVVAQGSVV